MAYKEKTIICKCGSELPISKKADWCTKCGGRIFYHEKDRRKHQFHTFFIVAVVATVFFAMAYFVSELIFPLL